MKKALILENTRGEVPVKHEMKKGDRIICPNGDEYSMSWNEQREAMELVKTISGRGAGRYIQITTVEANHIYIK
jgi:hypothetical protein